MKLPSHVLLSGQYFVSLGILNAQVAAFRVFCWIVFVKGIRLLTALSQLIGVVLQDLAHV